MKKKIIFLIGIIMIILMFLGGYLYLEYKYADTKELKKEDNLAIMVQDNIGKESYRTWDKDTWPSTSEYYFEKGDCEDNSKLTWNEATNSISLNSDKRDKCTVYFNKNKTFILLSNYEVENKDVTLTNILGSAGDFEEAEPWNGIEGFDGYDSYFTHCILSDDIKNHGNSSCKIPGDSKYGENLLTSANTYHMIMNHKYYAKFSIYNGSSIGADIELFWTTWQNSNRAIQFYGVHDEINKWKTFSYLGENIENESDAPIRIDNNNGHQNIDLYIDKLILIDLTESHGENIPSKEWLDQNLIYFDGTVNLKTAKGDTGVFKLTGDGNSISNKTLECNNGGSATVQNGIVTITGNAETTTCYLKKT